MRGLIKNSKGSENRGFGGSVEKGGTGIGKATRALVILALLALGVTVASAESDRSVMVAFHGDSIMISVQIDGGVAAGSVSEFSSYDGYYQAILFAQQLSSDNGGGASILVQGSGTGVASDPNQPCDDFGILVQGSGTGVASDGECIFDNPLAWGFAEVEQTSEGVVVAIHQVIGGAAHLYATQVISAASE